MSGQSERENRNGSSTNGYDVVGVGRAVYDFCVLLPEYPGWDQKTESIDSYESGGSPVPNALCQLALWGWRTLLCANIGQDVEGERFLKSTSSYGVCTDTVRELAFQKTPRAFIWVEKGTGRRTIVLDRDIDPLTLDDIPVEELKTCRSLLIDGWEAEAALEAAGVTRRAGGKVMLDAGNVRPQMDRLIEATDWFVAPMAFARAFYGDTDLEEVVSDLRSRGPEIVIITTGAEGCVASWDDETGYFPAIKAVALDTTGAGDVFHAGMLHGLLNGWNVPDCVRWASAASSISVQGLGGRGRLVNLNEISVLLEE